MKTYQFLNCDEQFLKKNRKQGSFAKLVRKNAFLKKRRSVYIGPKPAPYGTVLVQCLFGARTVLVRCLYGVLGLK